MRATVPEPDKADKRLPRWVKIATELAGAITLLLTAIAAVLSALGHQ